MSDSVTVIGIDFGLRRIGVAVGNTTTRTANPLSVIECRRGRPDWAALEAVVREWQPGSIVLGLPRRDDGSEHPLETSITEFATALSRRCRLPVETIDERLSSFEAGERAGPDGDDAVAAQVILETWLNEQS